jgi:putative transposase
MSRFRKLSHAIWHCQYHVVWKPKYRYRILAGQVREEVTNCIHNSWTVIQNTRKISEAIWIERA